MWNRFWMLLSTIWLGFCVYAFITTRQPIAPATLLADFFDADKGARGTPQQSQTDQFGGVPVVDARQHGERSQQPQVTEFGDIAVHTSTPDNSGKIDYFALAQARHQKVTKLQPQSEAAAVAAAPAGSLLIETDRGKYLVEPPPIRYSYKMEWLWMGFIGYVLWCMGRFVRYGFRMRPKETQK